MGQTDNEQTGASQNIEIQVGEPMESQIDYSMSEQELEKYVDEQMELILPMFPENNLSVFLES